MRSFPVKRHDLEEVDLPSSRPYLEGGRESTHSSSSTHRTPAGSFLNCPGLVDSKHKIIELIKKRPLKLRTVINT